MNSSCCLIVRVTIVLIGVCCWGGCVMRETPSDQMLTKITPTKTVIYTPKPLATYTSLIPPSVIPSPSPIVTTPSVQDVCLPIKDEATYPSNMTGSIVLNNYYRSSSPNHSFLLDMATGTTVSLPEQLVNGGIDTPFVSPNKKRLAYYGSKGVIILESSGTITSTSYQLSSSSRLAGWLDNETLLVSLQHSDMASEILGLDTLIALDISTNQIHTLTVPLPHISPDTTIDQWPNWGSFNNSKTIFSADLNYVIYPSITSNQIESLVLWDLQSNTPVTIITGTISNKVPPQWSPNGQGFIISAPYDLLSAPPKGNADKRPQELFLVSRSGIIQQLTHLHSIYTDVTFGTYSWSPDGKSIAIWVMLAPKVYPSIYSTIGPTDRGRLAILDLESLQFVDYCIPYGFNAPEPFWSPQGRQLVVQDFYQTSHPRKSNVYVVDLGHQEAFLIAQDVFPEGWMEP